MHETYKLIILPEAQQDIRKIIMYIALTLASPTAALDLQDAFEKEIKTLSRMPERFRTVDEQPWKDAGVRKARVRNYYIYYLISEPEASVKIMAVIYAGRDQNAQMSEREMPEN